MLSGEVERTYRLLREVGYAVQSEFHSPTSQYGQLSRRGRYDHLDFARLMRELTDDITSGRFADEWDAERDSGYPHLRALKEQHAGAAVRDFEAELRTRLGPERVPYLEARVRGYAPWHPFGSESSASATSQP